MMHDDDSLKLLKSTSSALRCNTVFEGKMINGSRPLLTSPTAPISSTRTLSSTPPRTPLPSHPRPGSASVLLSPSSASFDGDDDDHPTATENRLYLARLTLQYQEIRERYDLCFSHLQDAADEAEALRRENAKLRIANGELARRLALLSGKPSPRIPPPPLVDEFRRLGLGDPPAEASPTSVLGFQDPQSRAAKAAGAAEKRVVLPKSISIRSNGYLKLNQNQGCVGVGSGTNRNGRLRVPSPVRAGTVSPLS
uniref:Uncharacterized protein n=1 Tax=Ananas comosus var. bracteatus TaxID=296719 RepID=A0A6V7PTR8_ANACO|nr:unnamed protein product [Ananas comosus var. bracteatus]